MRSALPALLVLLAACGGQSPPVAPTASAATPGGDPVVATAILDRLLHHSHVLTIRGESYRLKAKRRSGLVETTRVLNATT